MGRTKLCEALRHDGRFGQVLFQHIGGHLYGPSVLNVGVEEAWKENDFRRDAFLAREGEYDWANGRRLPMAVPQQHRNLTHEQRVDCQ